eukprot:TRINITY_DN23516_c0_g1_i1.p1 TRINITY_DN23516_c0_g1~~TRINITY_DN23516_c0_g1_i1.p1  ORF type:complete len:849 (+),score=215.55 TRINITY_DN23516_c0_g1_i1:92-2638(+)
MSARSQQTSPNATWTGTQGTGGVENSGASTLDSRSRRALDAMFSLTYREGESAEERHRKVAFLPWAVIIFVLGTWWLVSNVIAMLNSRSHKICYVNPAQASCSGRVGDSTVNEAEFVRCSGDLPPPGCTCIPMRRYDFQFGPRCTRDPTPWVHWIAGLGTLTLAALCVLLCVFITRRLPLFVIESTTVTMATGFILVDWAASSSYGGRAQFVWPIFILLLDVLLVFHSRKIIELAVCALVVTWFMVRFAEDTTGGLGLTDFAIFTMSGAEPLEHSFKMPTRLSVSFLVIRVAVVVVDFWLSRGFAHRMHELQGNVTKTIEVTENIAARLAEYDTEGAARIIRGGADQDLPPRLRHAMAQLIEVLQEYRSFLPQSALVAACTEVSQSPTGGQLADGAPAQGTAGLSPEEEAAQESSGSTTPADLTTPLRPCDPIFQFFDAGDVEESMARGLGDTSLQTGAPDPDDVNLDESSDADLPNAAPRLLAPPTRAGREGAEGSQNPAQQGACTTNTIAFSRTPFRLPTVQSSRRNVAMIAVNITGFIQFCRELRPLTFGKLCAAYVSNVQEAVGSTRGVVDIYDGDRITCSWNASARSCSQFREGALTTATSISLQTAGAVAAECSPVPVGISLSMGVVSGNAVCGLFGSTTMRRHGCIGGVSTWVRVVERLASRWKARCLVDEMVANAQRCPENMELYLWPQMVMFQKRSADISHLVRPQPCRLYELIPSPEEPEEQSEVFVQSAGTRGDTPTVGPSRSQSIHNANARDHLEGRTVPDSSGGGSSGTGRDTQSDSTGEEPAAVCMLRRLTTFNDAPPTPVANCPRQVNNTVQVYEVGIEQFKGESAVPVPAHF